MKKDCTKYESTKQEKSVAKEVNGKTVIASGSLWGSKGDVRTSKLLIECKTTTNTYYPLTIETWNKIKHEAINDGLRLPVMSINLVNGKYRKAVFETSMFNFSDYFAVDKVSKHNSFRVTSENINITISGIKMTVIDWKYFLYLLHERKA